MIQFNFLSFPIQLFVYVCNSKVDCRIIKNHSIFNWQFSLINDIIFVFQFFNVSFFFIIYFFFVLIFFFLIFLFKFSLQKMKTIDILFLILTILISSSFAQSCNSPNISNPFGTFSNQVLCLEFIGNDLYAGGMVGSAGGVANTKGIHLFFSFSVFFSFIFFLSL